MKWFGKQWENSEHVFLETGRTWILRTKLSEKFSQGGEEEAIMPHQPVLAWATFLCEEKGRPGEKYVMKIYMQIPWTDSEMDPPEMRKLQAQSDLHGFTINELIALSELRDKRSTATPVLVDSYQETQSDNMCVPGGFLLFILMTYCPGSPLENFPSKPFSEREEIRQAEPKESRLIGSLRMPLCS